MNTKDASIYLGSQDQLIARLTFTVADEAAPRPIAFLTGAGISLGAVPGVMDLIHAARGPLSSNEQSQFDAELAPLTLAGEKYRQAFQFLNMVRPPRFRDRIIQIATLAACDHSDVNEDLLVKQSGQLESENDRWRLPAGQASLGRILAGLPADLRGPVLTTNFDPLTEIAVRRAGGSAVQMSYSDNGSFLQNSRIQESVCVIHLHGYWRDTPTLNLAEELAAQRASLEGSIKVLLERYTLVVLGYGGWTDVVTRALLSVVEEQRVEDLDVLWCLHEEAGPAGDAVAQHETLSKLRNATSNIRFYAGIDANNFLPALEKALSPHLAYSDAVAAKPPVAPLNWTVIDRAYLMAASSRASANSALSFFDGRHPAWHDAASAHVPIREISVSIANQIEASIGRGESSISIVIGPSAEGKTTIAMQACRLLALNEGLGATVLAIGDDQPFPTDLESQLPKSRPFVCLVDDAYLHVHRVQELVSKIQSTGRTDIHIIAVSRDTDWHASGGANLAWSQYVRAWTHKVHGLSHVDATSIVGAWESAGDEALGDLRNTAPEQRADRLVEASIGNGVRGNGSLLGAMLSIRFGAGLREHIRQLIARVKPRVVTATNTDFSLLEPLLTIAAVHSSDLLDLSARTLASALRISTAELRAYVLAPLGDEAAISYSADRILTRHEYIADEIVDIALEDDLPIENCIRQLVTAAVREVSREGVTARTMRLARLASHLDVPRLSLAAADAAVSAAPRELTYRTTRSRALRKAEKSRDAIDSNLEAVPLLWDPNNATSARGFFFEWSVAEGTLRRPSRNAVLAALVVLDSNAFPTPENNLVELAFGSLLLSFKRMYERDHNRDVLSGLAAVAQFCRSHCPETPLQWLRESERYVDQAEREFPGHHIGYPSASDDSEINGRIQDAIRIANYTLELPLPTSLPGSEGSLMSVLRRYSEGQPWWTK